MNLANLFDDSKATDEITEASGLTFMGSPCTKDCSGHKAGYEWSEKRGGQLANSHSQSFNNGAAISVNGKNKQQPPAQQTKPQTAADKLRAKMADLLGPDKAKTFGLAEEKCPECGGPMFGDLLLAEKKDACYNKVRSRYKVWPSAYASGALVQCRKKGAANWGNKSKNESVAEEQIDEKCWDTHKQVGMKKKGGKMVPDCVPKESQELDENLRDWFKEKWVRFGPDGKIRGDCARGDDSEGKPKCLPQAKAHALGKKGRASAAARKRKEDPNPERRGKAINVNTKKKTSESTDMCKVCGQTPCNCTHISEAAKLKEKWSQKYKNSINCSNPKGFSQKAHCAGKKKHNEDISRRDFLKGAVAAVAAGAAGKASAIAGAFPTPSHQAAMYKAAADSNAAQARADAAAKAKADAERLKQGTADIERLNKINFHGGKVTPINATWDGDSDFMDVDGTKYAMASRMPIRGDEPGNMKLVSTKEGRQVYMWTRNSLKGVVGRYFYPAPANESVTESRLYYSVVGTVDSELRSEFGLRKDSNGWYLKENADAKKKFQAYKAFGSPKLKEYDLSAVRGGSTGVISNADNPVSPVGSVPRGQQKSKR